MSRRSRRQSKNSQPSADQLRQLVASEVQRRIDAMQLPPGAMPRAVNQDALMQQMQAAQAPSKQGTPMFSPGAPLMPQPGLSPQGMPRQYSFQVGYNINSRPRSSETTSFDTLRNLAALYDGAMLCEQVWLDTVSKLNLVVKPRPELVAGQADSSDRKFGDDIKKYTDFFAYPDRGNGLDLKSWMRAAIRDQLQIDAVSIYMRRNRGGGLYSMELVDGTSVKPLIDTRGRRPAPPYPAFQQFLYGVPAGLYTSDDMLYIRETPRTDSIYGLSRIERIILRVNQALRKENKDLARFTDGNIPAGLLEPPDDGSQWTPEQFLAYQDMWDALLAGNDQARSRVKVVQAGSKYTPIDDADIYLDFDRFLLNVTTACYSMTMADLGFTESVNKSSGDSQENVFYRRAVQPLMERYATLFTYVLNTYFNDDRFVVSWSGYEEAEDFAAQATAYVALVGAGIVSPSVAARQMKLPVEKDIAPFVLTKDGPVFLEDVADPAMRQAANDAKLQGFKLAASAQPPPPPGEPGKAPDNVAVAPKGDKAQQSPPQSGAKQDSSKDDQADDDKEERTASSDRTVHSGLQQGDQSFFALAVESGGLPRTHSLPWRRG